MRKAKSILITGASGFIGSHLAEKGVERGYEVFAGVRPTSSLHYLTDPRIHILPLDLTSPSGLADQWNEFKKKDFRFDFIIHNAGATRAGTREEFFRINEGLTDNLVSSLEEAGFIPDKFLFMSSLAAIGPGNPATMEPISDRTSPHPIDAYGKSKLAAEQLVAGRSRLPYLIFRPTGVYGPRELDYQAVYNLIAAGLETYAGTSRQMISFIYIRDLCRLVFDALESSFERKSWVVSDGRNYSAAEFSALIKEILGKRTLKVVVPSSVVKAAAIAMESVCRPFGAIPVLNRDKAAIMCSRNWQCDPSDLFNDLTFTPDYDLRSGLTETLIP